MPKMTPETDKSTLWRIREALGFTREEAARLVDLHPQTIRKIEAGRMQMTQRYQETFARAYKVDPTVFLRDMSTAEIARALDKSAQPYVPPNPFLAKQQDRKSARERPDPDPRKPSIVDAAAEVERVVFDDKLSDGEFDREVKRALQALRTAAQGAALPPQAPVRSVPVFPEQMLQNSTFADLFGWDDAGRDRVAAPLIGNDPALGIQLATTEFNACAPPGSIAITVPEDIPIAGNTYFIRAGGQTLLRRYFSNPERWEPFSVTPTSPLFPARAVEVLGRVIEFRVAPPSPSGQSREKASTA